MRYNDNSLEAWIGNIEHYIKEGKKAGYTSANWSLEQDELYKVVGDIIKWAHAQGYDSNLYLDGTELRLYITYGEQ
jgi:hypothetical protein